MRATRIGGRTGEVIGEQWTSQVGPSRATSSGLCWRGGTMTRQFCPMPATNVREAWRVLVTDRMTNDDDLSLLPSEPSDAELVALARAHDERAFELLVRRHYRAAFAVALAYARTRLD